MFDLASLRPLTVDLPPIVILSTLDFGGAGIAALRLHQGLLAAGADVKMLVVTKQSKEPTVGELSVDGDSLDDRISAGWAKALHDYPARPKGAAMFSTAEAPFNFADLDLVKNAGLVNLHWCAGMLPWPAAGANLRGKPLVWTLHDKNPFTGGCHCVRDCERWRQGGCRECP
ncbi:MAG: hypothetical protein J6333_04970 [Planctomycetes bacterium]|nr:hypothetical protein [Planctomycetota bacterium]